MPDIASYHIDTGHFLPIAPPPRSTKDGDKLDTESEQAREAFKAAPVKQIVLFYQRPEYEAVMELFTKGKDKFGVGTIEEVLDACLAEEAKTV